MFGELQDWVMQNSAVQALVKFKAFMMYTIPKGTREGNDENRNYNQIGNFIRTVTTPNLLGEPASEGVHQDAQDYTITVLMKSHNVDWDAGSASSSIVNLKEPFGIPAAKINPENIIETVQHKRFLDTLMFLDSEVSHAVSSVYAKDKSAPAHRDMMVLFTRRLRKRGLNNYLAEQFDSETSHQELPFAMSLKSKYLSKYYPKSCRLSCQPPIPFWNK